MRAKTTNARRYARRHSTRTALVLTTLLVAAPGARADARLDLARQLENLHSPAPLGATVQLDLRLDQKLHSKAAQGQATLRVEVEQDATGLTVHWESSSLEDANVEERERDRDPDHLTPVRQAMTELDAARLGHLLDQASTIAGLTRDTPIEDEADSYEGHQARRLVYRFNPRLTWSDAYYLRRSEGRFKLWVAADGTPLGSESVASYEGKTGRAFGRFHGKTTTRTRYAVEQQRRGRASQPRRRRRRPPHCKAIRDRCAVREAGKLRSRPDRLWRHTMLR